MKIVQGNNHIFHLHFSSHTLSFHPSRSAHRNNGKHTYEVSFDEITALPYKLTLHAEIKWRTKLQVSSQRYTHTHTPFSIWALFADVPSLMGFNGNKMERKNYKASIKNLMFAKITALTVSSSSAMLCCEIKRPRNFFLKTEDIYFSNISCWFIRHI